MPDNSPQKIEYLTRYDRARSCELSRLQEVASMVDRMIDRLETVDDTGRELPGDMPAGVCLSVSDLASLVSRIAGNEAERFCLYQCITHLPG